jgi:hypothetical protein
MLLPYLEERPCRFATGSSECGHNRTRERTVCNQPSLMFWLGEEANDEDSGQAGASLELETKARSVDLQPKLTKLTDAGCSPLSPPRSRADRKRVETV